MIYANAQTSEGTSANSDSALISVLSGDVGGEGERTAASHDIRIPCIYSVKMCVCSYLIFCQICLYVYHQLHTITSMFFFNTQKKENPFIFCSKLSDEISIWEN